MNSVTVCIIYIYSYKFCPMHLILSRFNDSHPGASAMARTLVLLGRMNAYFGEILRD